MLEFEWDKIKEKVNIAKHGVSFREAALAFDDPDYVILPDVKHSAAEERFVCLGLVKGDVMTVRFTYRGDKIRIFGAAYWRKGRKNYEKDYEKE